jgi:hypothetical protein
MWNSRMDCPCDLRACHPISLAAKHRFDTHSFIFYSIVTETLHNHIAHVPQAGLTCHSHLSIRKSKRLRSSNDLRLRLSLLDLVCPECVLFCWCRIFFLYAVSAIILARLVEERSTHSTYARTCTDGRTEVRGSGSAPMCWVTRTTSPKLYNFHSGLRIGRVILAFHRPEP